MNKQELIKRIDNDLATYMIRENKRETVKKLILKYVEEREGEVVEFLISEGKTPEMIYQLLQNYVLNDLFKLNNKENKK